jgi:voltage-gated potassium channel
VAEGADPEREGRGFSVEKSARRVANARSVTFGLAASFFSLALVGGVVMRFADPDTYGSLGLAFWWALQTVTTVGYGDVVPETGAGKVVGAIEMMIGVSLISLLTAAVTSTVVQRGESAAREEERERAEKTAETIISTLTRLEDRLEQLESRNR